MSLHIGKLILESENPARLYHFLSFIFDIEADKRFGDDIYFESENLRFLINKTDSLVAPKTAFTISVQSQNEKEEVLQSAEFYYYKEGINSKNLISQNEDIAIFTDPDGRKWQVEVACAPGKTNSAPEQISPIM